MSFQPQYPLTSESASPVRRRVAVTGVFDGVHLGHRYLLDRAAHIAGRNGDVVAVTFSDHPLRLIAPERVPEWITQPEHRNALLSAITGPENVIVMDFDQQLRLLTAAQFIQMLHDRYGVTDIVLGHDHGFGSDRLRDTADYQAAAELCGVTVHRAPAFTLSGLGAVSSSAIRHALCEGRISDANRMLGLPLYITGKIVHGRADGRKMGFPTANILTQQSQLIPARGVYAATLNGMPAMLNIGLCPTLTNQQSISIEAHVINTSPNSNFSIPSYGDNATLRILSYLRPEHKFSSPQELIAQLSRDREAALTALKNNI